MKNFSSKGSQVVLNKCAFGSLYCKCTHIHIFKNALGAPRFFTPSSSTTATLASPIVSLCIINKQKKVEQCHCATLAMNLLHGLCLCDHVRASFNARMPHLQPLPIMGGYRWSLDFVGPLLVTLRHNKYVLVIFPSGLTWWLF